ncbi:MAG: N-acetyltransferase [Candidatus Accumulibacter sp.]|jgi:predicted GNAT family acetyltransferase|nr:N-acetyltransferase [Accumulibacter sp.]
MEMIHRDNGEEGAFVMKDGASTTGEITYFWTDDDRIAIDHTGVRRQYEGHGLGKKLVDAVVGFAREKKIGIVPLCPFARALFDKDPSYGDVRSE